MKIDEELSLCNEFFKKMQSYEYGSVEYQKCFMEAFKHCVNAADLGDVRSLYTVGRIYFDGRDIPKNYDLAFKYLSLVYDSGNYFVIPILAYCYMRGLGTAIDLDKATLLFTMINDTYSIDICERLKHNCGIKVIDNMSELSSTDLKNVSSDIGLISIEPKANFSWEMHTYYRVEDYELMINKVESILKDIDFVLDDHSNEYDVFMQIYCTLGLLISYDKSAGMNGKDVLKSNFTSRNLFDALINNKCTCGGGSELLRNVLAFRGISSINVFSSNHAFNQVKIGDTWYNADLIEDLKNIKNGFVDFCLKSDIIREDREHIPLSGTVFNDCFSNCWDINDIFKKAFIHIVQSEYVLNELYYRSKNNDDLSIEKMNIYKDLICKYYDTWLNEFFGIKK